MDVREYFLTVRGLSTIELLHGFGHTIGLSEPNLIGAWQCDNQVTNQQVSRPHTRVNVHLF